MPTVAAITSIGPMIWRGGSSDSRRQARIAAATAAAITDRPAPTKSGLNDLSAAVVAGNVRLKQMTPSIPSASGPAFASDAAFEFGTEVLLLALMNDDSNSGSAQVGLELLIKELPPESRLPSYRELQERYRLGPATVRRVLADLTRRGLVETRPGSGTYTAPRRVATAPADVAWQTLALGTRIGLGADLERMVTPSPADAISMASGFLDERLQPLGLLAAAATRAARRPQAWNRLPAQGLTELRAHFAAETGAALTAQNVVITPGGQAALSAAFRHLAGPGDPLIVESPTYVGALAAARGAGLRLVPVPGDRDGMQPQALSDALVRTSAKLVYLQPRYSTPSSLAARS